MKHKDAKLFLQSDKRSAVIPVVTLFTLCACSFYLGGLLCSNSGWFQTKTAHNFLKVAPADEVPAVGPLRVNITPFPECSIEYQDYTPCTDPKRWKKYSMHRLAFLERHCPPVFEKKECLVPPPVGYKVPIRWPQSHNECWYRNVPYDWINTKKANQNWLRKEGEKFVFPGGGTMFPRGVHEYVDHMQELIPQMRDGSIRTAIDTGCGVASWGGDLLDRGILTVSLAPRDNHEAQVQFALERGIPAILGILATQRLPFPSNAFDIAHCSRCLIPWTEFGGVYLLEIHRILRPGGFWVLSGPPINYAHRWQGWNTTREEQRSDYRKLQEMLSSMCFERHDEKDDIAVWQKSADAACYAKLAVSDSYPPQCDDSLEPDSAWYTPLRPCVIAPRPEFGNLSVGSAPKWPERLHDPPARVSGIRRGSPGLFRLDDKKWKERVERYRSVLPEIGSDKVRNVMDMNAYFGGFAAALVNDPLWVMNVVSSYGMNTLGVIFDRGLIGTYHDWCEAFSTYPRTYDLLHVDGLFTAESHRCEIKHVLLEMDRILRPMGYVLVRESTHFVGVINAITGAMRWNCRIENTEPDTQSDQILVCQKRMWHTNPNNTAAT